MLEIWAVLTSHNRRDSTVECLRRLQAAGKFAAVELRAVLVDDGSTDGTANVVAASFDWVKVIHGDGGLFWNRGMHLGFSEALRHNADAYLWVNDDTHIFEDALLRLVNTWKQLEHSSGKPVLVAGATADKKTGEITYGGDVAPSKLRRFSYHRVWSDQAPVLCHAAQGNCFLIPRAVAGVLGNLDPVFEHAMGDTDYTLRARQAGFKIYVAPGVIGYCSDNRKCGTFEDNSLPLRQRWKLMMQPKGLPPRSWLRFTRRHGGFAWPIYFLWPYLHVVADSVRRLIFR